jgi:hypothetical protein
VVCTVLYPLYEINLYLWYKRAGFIYVVLHLMTEEEPTGKMLCVYQKKNHQR